MWERCSPQRKADLSRDLLRSVMLVAGGARNQRYLQLWSIAA
jgi:hypothetical protein